MRWVRMQIAGVCVAVVTGVLAMLLATFAGGILGVLDLMGMTGDPASSPLIGAGRNGVIFSIVIVVLGSSESTARSGAGSDCRYAQ